MGNTYNRIYTPEVYDKVNPENKEICSDFLTECKAQKKSEGTIKQYANDLRILCCYVYRYVNNKSFLDLTKRDFRNFVLHCTDEYGMSSARVNRLLSAIHSLFSFCEDDDELYEDYDRNASAKVKGLPKQQIREMVFIPNDILQQLYDKFMEEKRFRDATLLAILYESGCRKNEIIQVRRDSITDDGHSTNQVIGKRGKKFKCIYFSHTKEAFKEYEKTRTDKSEYLFSNLNGEPVSSLTLYNWVKNWVKDLEELSEEDYSGLNVHSFRHCFIQNCSDGTHWICDEFGTGAIPIEKIKILAHHENVSTTDSYRANDEEKDIENLFGIKL